MRLSPPRPSNALVGSVILRTLGTISATVCGCSSMKVHTPIVFTFIFIESEFLIKSKQQIQSHKAEVESPLPGTLHKEPRVMQKQTTW